MTDSMKSSLPRGTLVMILADDKPFAATQLVAGGQYDEYVLTGSDFLAMGPGISDIVIHAEGVNFTANFTYDVRLQYKFRYGAWQDVSLLGLQNNGNYIVGAAFNDRTKLGMQVRIVLRTQSSGAAVQRGTLSIAAAVRFYNGT